MPYEGATRRRFLQRTAMLGATLALDSRNLSAFFSRGSTVPLEPFGYADVTLDSELCSRQLENTHAVLMSLDEDALMQPFRVMSGLPSSGGDLGGWYIYKPDYDYRKDSAGLCPGGTFGQWISALARYYAITGDSATRDQASTP